MPCLEDDGGWYAMTQKFVEFGSHFHDSRGGLLAIIRSATLWQYASQSGLAIDSGPDKSGLREFVNRLLSAQQA